MFTSFAFVPDCLLDIVRCVFVRVGGNDLNLSHTSNLYPSLDDALSASLGSGITPSAPELDSDEDNESITLPSYEDVISGKV